MKYRILAKLQEHAGQYVSGADLARELGITRTAVWKHIDSLKKEGYRIEGVSNRGYRLLGNPEGPPDSGFGRQLLCLGEVDSTNAVARRLLKEDGLPHGTVLVAESQTQGRGRRGRQWQSPVGGLWFSLILRPELTATEVAKLSLVFAVALADGMERYLPGQVRVKWPNDVLVNRRKVAGVLLEMEGEFDKIEYVIAGIGINVNVLPEVMPGELRATTTSLMNEMGVRLSLEKVLRDMLLCLEQAYDSFLRSGWLPFRRRFTRKCIHYGQCVTIRQGDKVLSGTDLGVDEWGCLRLKTAEGDLYRISAGDVVFD